MNKLLLHLLIFVSIFIGLAEHTYGANKCESVFKGGFKTPAFTYAHTTTYQPDEFEAAAKSEIRYRAQQISRKRRQQLFDAFFGNEDALFGRKGESIFAGPQDEIIWKYGLIPTRYASIHRLLEKEFYYSAWDKIPSSSGYSDNELSYIRSLISIANGPLFLMNPHNRTRIFVDDALAPADEEPSMIRKFFLIRRGFKEPVQTQSELREIKTVQEAKEYLRRQAYLEEEGSPIAAKELNRRIDLTERALKAPKVFTAEDFQKISLTKRSDLPQSLREYLAVLELEKASSVTNFTLANFQDAKQRYSSAVEIAIRHLSSQLNASGQTVMNYADYLKDQGTKIKLSDEEIQTHLQRVKDTTVEVSEYAQQVEEVRSKTEQLIAMAEQLRTFASLKIEMLPENEREQANKEINEIDNQVQIAKAELNAMVHTLNQRFSYVNSALNHDRLILTDLMMSDSQQQYLKKMGDLSNQLAKKFHKTMTASTSLQQPELAI